MIEILQIGLRDSLILFPLVLGVGLLYSHLKILDISVDGVAVASGIVCAFTWNASHSYSLSILVSIVSGILCSSFVCMMVSKFSVHPTMSGLIFSIAMHSISILVVGESISLFETNLVQGFSSIPLWLLISMILVATGSYIFFMTRLGGEIRAHGSNPFFGTKYSPFILRLTVYGLAGGLYGLSSAVYVHSEGLARSGGGFDFLILSLCAYLSVDRFMFILQNYFYKLRRSHNRNLDSATNKGRILGNLMQSPPLKAFLGILFFQNVVFLTISYSPNPAYWKLFMSFILAASLIYKPRFFSFSHNENIYPADLDIKSTERLKAPEINIQSLGKSYDLGIERRKVFDKINIRFCRGVTLLNGPNGSGKSTLLQILKGTISADYGKIYFQGTEISSLVSHKRPIFLIHQNPFQTLAGDLSIIDNLALANVHKERFPFGGLISAEKTLEVLFSRLSELGISPIETLESSFWHKPAISISGGQANCIAFYMAILSEKEIILADEPSTGLDSINFDRLKHIIDALGKDKIIIITTHDHRLNSIGHSQYQFRDYSILMNNRENYESAQ